MGSGNTPLGRCHLLGYFVVLLNQGIYLCEKNTCAYNKTFEAIT